MTTSGWRSNSRNLLVGHGWCIALLWLFFPNANASVHEQAAQDAVIWLETIQADDGSWSNGGRLHGVVTAEVTLALLENLALRSSYFKGITWLENHASTNVDDTSRRALTLFHHGNDLTSPIARLVSAQRTSSAELGGWGLSGGYESSPLESSLALAALRNNTHTADVQAAIDYLKASQLTASGNGWAMPTAQQSNPFVTALVVLGLQANAALDAGLPTVIANALSGLVASVDGNSSEMVRALAALALLRDDAGSTYGLSLLAGLVTTQTVSGSFADDPFLTATILRAIATANEVDVNALTEQVHFSEIALHAAINSTLNKNRLDGIVSAEINNITVLDLSGTNVSDLSGLVAATNLTTLDLTGTNVSTLAPLIGMSSFTQITYQGEVLTATGDVDNDSLADLDEVNAGLDPLSDDTDGDGLSDSQELAHNTHPLIPDSDGDGLSDGDEVLTYGSDPLEIDTDGDYLSDGDEVNEHGSDPTLTDTDSDGLDDYAEVNTYFTDPSLADTDGGSRSDGEEVDMGRDPLLARDDIMSEILIIQRQYLR